MKGASFDLLFVLSVSVSYCVSHSHVMAKWCSADHVTRPSKYGLLQLESVLRRSLDTQGKTLNHYSGLCFCLLIVPLLQ